MLAIPNIGSSLRDLARFGPRFWYSGLRAKFGRRGVLPVVVPGNGLLHVRSRDSDFSTLRQVFRDGEYELPIASVQERIRKRCAEMVAAGVKPVIVDAGANIGAASVWFKRQFPEAAVVAIEPDPGSAAILRKNLAGLPDTVVIEAAIGGQPGHVAVLSSDRSWAVQTKREEKGCPIVTVRDAVAAVPGGTPFIVKIDIEGFEEDLFASNTEWIDDAFVVMVEPHDWMLPGRRTSRGFQAAFGKRDFDIFLRGENIIYVRP